MRDPLAVSYKGQEGSGLAQVLPKSSFDVSEASKEMFEKTFAFELKKQQENKARAAALAKDLTIEMKSADEKKKLEVINEQEKINTDYANALADASNRNVPLDPKVELALRARASNLQSKMNTYSEEQKTLNDFISGMGKVENLDHAATLENIVNAKDENGNLIPTKLQYVFNENEADIIQKEIINPIKESIKRDVSVRDANGGIIETKVENTLESDEQTVARGRRILASHPQLQKKYNTPEELAIWDNLVLSSKPKKILEDYQQKQPTAEIPTSSLLSPGAYVETAHGDVHSVSGESWKATSPETIYVPSEYVISETGEPIFAKGGKVKVTTSQSGLMPVNLGNAVTIQYNDEDSKQLGKTSLYIPNGAVLPDMIVNNPEYKNQLSKIGYGPAFEATYTQPKPKGEKGVDVITVHIPGSKAEAAYRANLKGKSGVQFYKDLQTSWETPKQEKSYSTEQENGINAVMKNNNISREEAINALKEAGKL